MPMAIPSILQQIPQLGEHERGPADHGGIGVDMDSRLPGLSNSHYPVNYQRT